MSTEHEDPEVKRSFAEAREYARGVLDVEHHDAHPIAGLVDDPDVRSMLAFMAEVYEPVEEMPRNFWDTDYAQEVLRQQGTEAIQTGVENGNSARLSYITGMPNYESDVSGLHAINQLADWLIHSEQCKLIYLAALMGRGKTDLSLTFCEIIQDHYDRVRRSTDDETTIPEFAANFHVNPTGDTEMRHIDNYDDLLEWGEQGSSEDVRWFIFDEASTELTAQSGGNAQDVAREFAPFVKKMRKNGINMIVIGHDRQDVHPAIRSIADFVDKTGLKTASFYAGIKQREPTGHLFDVEGIPPTSWEFDTNDTAEWSWGDEIEADDPDEITDDDLRDERDERIARLYSLTDLSQRDLATAFNVSQATVSAAVKRFEVVERSADNSPVATAD